ncbi:pyridoxamine 5'-phosphate oxidase family protein ['Paenibacillus yunnanensis' Narsing Rao et al. 2020]|uniref:pyridoxamine 5'-phosphate oxidase family protein n=1 Tax=Paenibacillus tengchongensis TaxID=2608684 RepID=UPI00124D461F|nr:pyridoxamine 5'-phosphate oxidase family protein [Paenibacillus tengchongensis]
MEKLDRSQFVGSEDELRALIGYPGSLVQNKVVNRLDEHCRQFIAQSPLAFLSTADAAGRCDVSPRGDHPGFVQVMDGEVLVIPERRGNKRIDSLRNIVSNPQIGLLFLVPGLKETLRINGRAYVTRDQELLAGMAVQNQIPVVGIVVQVEECFLHCGKAMLRSRLWEPGTWPSAEQLPSAARMLAQHARAEGMSAEEIAVRLDEGYNSRLY